MNFSAAKLPALEDAQNAAAFAQRLVRAIGANHERSRMSGIGVAKQAAGDIKHRVEKSDEAVAGDAAAKQAVDGAAQFLGRYGWRSKPAYGGLQIRHQQRGGHSL